jgi:hypothetical protein
MMGLTALSLVRSLIGRRSLRFGLLSRLISTLEVGASAVSALETRSVLISRGAVRR